MRYLFLCACLGTIAAFAEPPEKESSDSRSFLENMVESYEKTLEITDWHSAMDWQNRVEWEKPDKDSSTAE